MKYLKLFEDIDFNFDDEVWEEDDPNDNGLVWVDIQAGDHIIVEDDGTKHTGQVLIKEKRFIYVVTNRDSIDKTWMISKIDVERGRYKLYKKFNEELDYDPFDEEIWDEKEDVYKITSTSRITKDEIEKHFKRLIKRYDRKIFRQIRTDQYRIVFNKYENIMVFIVDGGLSLVYLNTNLSFLSTFKRMVWKNRMIHHIKFYNFNDGIEFMKKCGFNTYIIERNNENIDFDEEEDWEEDDGLGFSHNGTFRIIDLYKSEGNIEKCVSWMMENLKGKNISVSDGDKFIHRGRRVDKVVVDNHMNDAKMKERLSSNYDWNAEFGYFTSDDRQCDLYILDKITIN